MGDSNANVQDSIDVRVKSGKVPAEVQDSSEVG